MQNKIKKRIWQVIALLPLVLGTIGYIKGGITISNSFYGAIKLYGMSVLPDVNNIYIEIAKWTAPLVTATSILAVIKSAWQAIKSRLSLFGREDGVAVYSDVEREIKFDKGVKAIYPGDKFKKYASEHIIMFSSDQKNLQFYEEHKGALKEKKNVYVVLDGLEFSILKAFDSKVSIIDINGAIARLLWKKISLWKWDAPEINIVIWGNSPLTAAVISTGIQLNLFSLNQHVVYHIVTSNECLRARRSDLNLMNNDEIHFYSTDDSEIWEVFSNARIIIVADTPEIETFETIVVKAINAEIYYYSPKDGDAGSYLSYGKIIPFGRDEVIYTDDNIRRKGLVKKAIALNEHYAKEYDGERNWNQLSGFLKASNISASDFGEVVLSDLNDIISEDEQAELEHIRWCRFMYLNYYKYGIPENGKNRDDIKRIHKDLIAYDELTPGEKEKDLESIRITRNL